MVNGLSSAGSALGAAVSMAIGISIIGPMVGGWRNIAITLGTITFILAVAWALLVRERTFGERPVQTIRGVMKGLAFVLHLKSVWILSIVGLLLFGHSGAWSSHMPGFFEHKYGMTNALAGQLVSVTLFAGVIAAVLGPTITDRTGLRKPAILIACVMGGLLNFIQGSFLGPVLFVILMIMPFGLGTIAPLLFTIPFETKELPHAVSGAAVGIIITFQNLGAFIYPVISGKLIDLFAPNYYPYFAAQTLAFGLSFLLVWLLLPETGPLAAKEAAAPETAGVFQS
jgi:nitrate/nitrite transporter NarK